MQMKKAANLKKELRNARAIAQCANEFNMVGDPTRLKICYLLCHHKELSVGEIADLVDVSISAVSRTLKKLKEANVVTGRRDFRTVYYALKPSPLATFVRERLCH
ncbi:MAG: winged helix-turn-helix transcriptional regulator [Patescibacteria group bacterium]|nr:winged helix-turn-helix transcriptional regulator [Patescibacteria group bacterium]